MNSEDVVAEEYMDCMLLVGINYNRQTKRHECMIEKIPHLITPQKTK